VGAEIVRQAVAKGSRDAWFAHRTELIDQTCLTLQEYGLDVGAVSASSCWDSKPSAPVQVCSIQTLLAREHRPMAQLIIWDEAHHASEGAEEWAKLLDAYPNVHMLGLTATPERSDGAGLAPLFDDLVVGATVRQLTDLGHLVPCEMVRPDKLLESGHLAQPPLDAYREHALGRQGFLFAKSVEEAQRYAQEFTDAGIRTVAIHAKTPAIERSAALELFREGRVKLISNVYVFTEGTDLPMASVCILARGASTAGIYLQMVGRVLRPHAGKRSAVLIDLRGVSHEHGPPEEERLYSLEGRGIRRAAATCKVCGSLIEAYPCAQCGYAPEAGDGPDDSVVDDVPLVKFARKIAEGPEARWATCVRWVTVAARKGHKIASVRYKWKHVYQEDLPFAWLRAAEDIVVRGAPDKGPP
jgi:superfamily II DNA or RNA helicase